MNDERTARSSSGATWTTAVVTLLVVYLLSPGLLAWWQIRLNRPVPSWLRKPLEVIYTPIVAAMAFKPVRDTYAAYMEWCAGQPLFSR